MNRISGQQLSVLPFLAVALKSLQRQQHIVIIKFVRMANDTRANNTVHIILNF